MIVSKYEELSNPVGNFDQNLLFGSSPMGKGVVYLVFLY